MADAKQLKQAMDSVNMAEDLDEDQLADIGEYCSRGFEADLASREAWEQDLEEWMSLACQIREAKNFPWENASNVKYPLMGIAAMQFSARAYPTLVPSSGDVVKARVIGLDTDGAKADRGRRVARYMSWQLQSKMSYWDEDTDLLLSTIPITGNMYRKTWWDPFTKSPQSSLVPVENFVVDYWAKSIEAAERSSEIIDMYPRQLQERVASKVFLEQELGDPMVPQSRFRQDSGDVVQDHTTPYEIIEQHTWLQLIEDDESWQPYVVTFDRATHKVLRIVARFDPEKIEVNEDGQVGHIQPTIHYTKYGFIPNPDGSFYDLGFGHMLGPLNESVNTLVNQLIDAGALNNLQSGFLGKGLRVKGGDYKFTPGEWKWVNSMGDDLKKQIVPLPSKEPSKVLMELLQFLITAGKELASVAEIFVGKSPGQNTPATTTMATIEQGMKVFTAIYKRVYRSLDKEFKKLYNLNRTYFDENEYAQVTDDDKVSAEDFNADDYDICPSADPTSTSQTERVAKAETLLKLVPFGLDPNPVVMRMLVALEIEKPEELFPGYQETGQAQLKPPPDPKTQQMQMKMNADQQKAAMDQQQTQQKMEMDARSEEAKLAMKAQEHQMDMQFEQQKGMAKAQADEAKQRIFMQQAQSDANTKEVQNQQAIRHGEEKHQSQMKQQAESAKSKQSQSARKSSSPGSKTRSRRR